MRFPTKELTTDANACTKRKRKDEIFLTIFVIANDLSPNCSIVIKKTNQLPNTNPCCNIIQIEIDNIFFKIVQSTVIRFLNPYLQGFIFFWVYMIKWITATASEMTDAMAAPEIPCAGIPNAPNIKI